MTAAPGRPRLARRARLRRDPVGGGDVLLYPERGLALSPSASEVLRLCDGTRTVAGIADALHARHPEAPRETILRDVEALVAALAERLVLEDAG
ncbi:MAG TPA: pyrroloquinoline quinone biosynthesis peptide chaperone PqqD [Anaeromyxobacteraceae bacterium]|nr:pyrroloquinoline quinone biosynthesis peptide chaperone PqqD [Anaeromyxobacteraceae bacterium]